MGLVTSLGRRNLNVKLGGGQCKYFEVRTSQQISSVGLFGEL